MKERIRKATAWTASLAAILLLLAAVALGTRQPANVSAQAITVPEGSASFGGSRYKVYDEYKTWTDAKAYCESLGGHLATVTSKEEQDFVGSLLDDGQRFVYFLGGTDAAKEGEWRWITDEKWEYENWRSGEPDNWGGKSHYLVMLSPRVTDNSYVKNAAYKWGDYTDIGYITGDQSGYWKKPEHFGFICEWEVACVDEAGNVYESHEESDWIVDKEPACDTAGMRHKVCLRCDDEVARAEIPAAGHVYANWTVKSGNKFIPPIKKQSTCTVCGETHTRSDWHFVWVPIVTVLGVIFVVFGLINYMRVLRKNKP